MAYLTGASATPAISLHRLFNYNPPLVNLSARNPCLRSFKLVRKIVLAISHLILEGVAPFQHHENTSGQTISPPMKLFGVYPNSLITQALGVISEWLISTANTNHFLPLPLCVDDGVNRHVQGHVVGHLCLFYVSRYSPLPVGPSCCTDLISTTKIL
ncbi:hypothetical protein K439DRAFT_1658820 [Ramaria rubella]|nr:hypothetical protein K439DRAFT_1658820 [Ramaria rubella]